jgi:hypothetical protein
MKVAIESACPLCDLFVDEDPTDALCASFVLGYLAHAGAIVPPALTALTCVRHGERIAEAFVAARAVPAFEGVL